MIAGRSRSEHEREPGSFGWLLLLVPLLCCGGPLLFAAAPTLGALGWGAVGGAVALLTVAGLVAARRRSHRCCEPETSRPTEPGPSSAINGRTVTR